MRCPKCSFISFDVLETCVKCGKKISAAAEELKGTVASVTPPPFLKFDFAEPEPESVGEGSEEAFDLGAEDEEVFVDFGDEEGAGEESVDVALDEESPVEEPVAEEPAIEEPVAEQEVVEEEPILEIDDVAAPEEEPVVDDVDIALEEPESESEPEPESAESGESGAGLEDLKVDIDLDASTAPAADGGKVMPSVKTGTALDDFDIDLGDLLPKQ